MGSLARTIQTLSPAMLACLDRSTGLINFHNPVFAERLGYPSSQILEHSIFQFIDESSFIPLAKALKTLQANAEQDLNVFLKTASGQLLETSLQVCRRGEDDFLVYLFFIDITAHSQKDQDLAVYQQIISSSKELMSLVSRDFIYVVANQAYLNHFKIKEEDIVGHSVWEIHGDKAAPLVRKLEETFQNKKTVRFQAEINDPVTQETIHIDSMHSPYVNPQGEVVGAIVCARDVSIYIKTGNAIRSSNLYYKTLFQHSPDLLAAVNLKTGLILDANQTLERVLGYEKSELTGLHLFKFHGKAHKKVLAEAIVDLSKNNPIHSLAVSLIAKDGSCISADLKTTPIIEDDSSIAIFVWRDTRYQEKLAYKAAHDPLTHLLNRSGFMPLLEKPFNEQETRVLCFIDIDNFKQLNDSCGHLCGDEFLIDMAELLRQHISQHDRLCRLGGDEFLILICQRERDDVYKLMKVILLKINMLIKGQHKYLSAKLGVSIGLTSFQSNESSRDVLKRADDACYQSKRNGKNQISIDDGCEPALPSM